MALAEAKALVNSLHRYSPDSVPVFEAAVEEQVQHTFKHSHGGQFQKILEVSGNLLPVVNENLDGRRTCVLFMSFAHMFAVGRAYNTEKHPHEPSSTNASP